jgi:hypothetical protein
VFPHFCAPAILAAMTLPSHVAGPGAGHVALGAGFEGSRPAADLRVGLWRFLTVQAEGVWNPDAPLVGGALRLAAGSKGKVLFANAWLEGHLRPLLTEDITEPLAGSDAGAGLGVVALWGPLSVALDGGMALGIPVVEVSLTDVERTAIDQQGGLFALQRVTLGVDIGDHVGLAVHGSFAMPIDSVRFNRRDENVLGTWDTRLGGRALLRW